MPVYTYKCTSCEHVDENVLVSLSKIQVGDDKRVCSACQSPMDRQFPGKTHTNVDRSVDGSNIGKTIQRKNDALKAREGGYSHEQKNLRRDIEKKTQEILDGK